MQPTDWQLLATYFSGELSPQEQKQVLDWADSHPDHRLAFEQAKQLWQAAAQELPLPHPNTDAQWVALQGTIEAIQTPATLVKLLQTSFRPYYWAAAAVFVVLIGIGFSYWQKETVAPTPVLASSTTRVHTTSDSLQVVYLPDSSRVWLNHHSELSYVESYGKVERRVKLTGQAFFEVKSDASRAFYVETVATRTRVLGTSFDVSAYPDQPTIDVSVVSGKVAFYAINDSLITGLTLLPNETGTFRKTEGLLTKRKTSNPPHLAWRVRASSIHHHQPESKQPGIAPAIRSEKRQLSRFLKVTSKWRKNVLNQTSLEGTIKNTSDQISYTAVKLRYRIFTKQGKQKLNYFTIRQPILPGETISYKRTLMDVLTSSSKVNVEIAEVETTHTTTDPLKK